MIYLVIVGGLVAIVAALVRLNRPAPDQRPNHIHTRKPR